MNNFRGKTALVTGASSGIGKEIAILLAEAGCHLVLVARRKDRLKELEEHIKKEHNLNIVIAETDLSDMAACVELTALLTLKKVDIDILVNNAGFGYGGAFVEQDWQRQQEMMKVNIDALTYLTKYYSEKMVESGEGHILLVSSVGGFTPCPGLAIYDATKAYVLVFGESLHYELKKKGVTITTLCPGATRTEFFDVAGQELSFMIKRTMMSGRSAANIGLKCMARGRAHAIPGFTNKLAVWGLRLAPRRFMAPIANQTISAL
ncbi:MAG: SDR family oxidoreductase [Pseudomonadales bacterium]|nr:SDR family oxidoreductase [Pseudomonadales bacterium]